MTKCPGIGGGKNGAPGVTVLYCAALTILPKYPIAPPPRVHGTTAVLAISCRNLSCNLTKVGSPVIFVSTLYSKYNSLRFIFDAVLVLEKFSWRYSVIVCWTVVTCTFDTLYRFDH